MRVRFAPTPRDSPEPWIFDPPVLPCETRRQKKNMEQMIHPILKKHPKYLTKDRRQKSVPLLKDLCMNVLASNVRYFFVISLN